MNSLIKTEKSELLTGSIDLSQNIIKNIWSMDIPMHPPIVVYDRVCYPSRQGAFYSDEAHGYEFANGITKASPLTDDLKYILDYINNEFNEEYNGILINRYREGSDYIGAHSDDERYLGKQGVLAVVLGATRKFRIRDKKTKKIVKDIDVEDGSVVYMKGNFQKEFTHEVPKQLRIKEPRISLTFRVHQKS